MLLEILFGTQHIPLEKNKEYVRAFQELQSHLLEKYEGIERELPVEAQNNAPFSYRVMTVCDGIHRCCALLIWCDETLETLRYERERQRQIVQGLYEVKRSIPDGKGHSRTIYGTD